MGTRVFVGNLSWSTSEDNLRVFFEQEGKREVVDVRIINDRETGKSRGFGFVEFANDDGARSAIDDLNGQELEGRQVAVKEAHAKDDRGSGPPRGERRDRRGRSFEPRDGIARPPRDRGAPHRERSFGGRDSRSDLRGSGRSGSEGYSNEDRRGGGDRPRGDDRSRGEYRRRDGGGSRGGPRALDVQQEDARSAKADWNGGKRRRPPRQDKENKEEQSSDYSDYDDDDGWN